MGNRSECRNNLNAISSCMRGVYRNVHRCVLVVADVRTFLKVVVHGKEDLDWMSDRRVNIPCLVISWMPGLISFHCNCFVDCGKIQGWN